MTQKNLHGNRILLIGTPEPILQINLTQPPTAETLIGICYKAQDYEGLLSTGSILTMAQDGRKLFFRFRIPGPEVVFPTTSPQEQESVLLSLSRGIGITLKSTRRNGTPEPRRPINFYTISEFLSSLGISEKDSCYRTENGSATLVESFFKKQG